MNEEIKDWCYSIDDMYWSPEEEYATKEEAIEAGKKDKDCIDKGYFHVGKQVKIDNKFLTERVRLFDLDDFNEQMAEEAGGEENYAAEDTANLKLVDELNDIISKFIVEKFNTTMSYTIEDCEEISIN